MAHYPELGSLSRCFLTGGLQDNNMKHLVKIVRGLVGAGSPRQEGCKIII